MIPILAPEGVAALTVLAGMRTLYAFDLDGTLAQIEPDPNQVQVMPVVSRVAARLTLCADLAVISGRSIEDIPLRIDFQPRWLVGNHGAEIETGIPFVGRREEILRVSAARQATLREQCRGWADALGSRLDLSAHSGIWLENKQLSLTLHFRRAPDRLQARERIMEAVQRLDPRPQLMTGLHSVHLLAPEAPDKWQAIEQLMSAGGYQTALYAGDEETDERVFRQAPAHWVTIRIGDARGSAARFALHDQGGITNLLLAILVAMREQAPPY